MSEYPSDWQVVKLADIAAISASNVDKKVREGQKPVQLCNYMDVFQNSAITKNLHFMESTASEKEIRDFSLFKGDVLLTKDSEIPEEIGVPSVVKDDVTDLICGYHLYILQPRKSQIDPEYLCWSLRNASVRKYFYQMANGSTRFGLNAKHVEECPIALPSLPEQKKIAEILSGIDRVLEKTRNMIHANHNLRAGLLREQIGKFVPTTKLDAVATRVSGHTPSKSHPEYWNGGIPWISLTDTAKLDKRYITHTAKQISEKGIQNSSAVLHPPGLVVLSRDANVGCSAITTKPMAVSQHFIGWICGDSINNKFLYYLLQDRKPRFQAIAMGSTIPTIGLSFFRDLEIPVPSLKEQKKISDALNSVDMKVDYLENKVSTLKNMKQAIAADLLSGRKRVSV